MGMLGKTSINTNVKDTLDIQRALETIKTELDKLKEKLEVIPESVEDETVGQVGSIRIIKNTNNESFFEIKSEDGWKKPMLGETQITLKKLKSNINRVEKKSIDELETEDSNTDSDTAKKTIFDEKASKFVIARPDYDSGWTANASADAATTLTHNLGTQDFSLLDLRAGQSSSGSNTTWVMLGSNTHSNTGKKGYIVQIVDNDSIKVGIAQDGVPQFHCAGLSGEGVDFTHFRLRIWK